MVDIDVGLSRLGLFIILQETINGWLNGSEIMLVCHDLAIFHAPLTSVEDVLFNKYREAVCVLGLSPQLT